MQIVWTGASDVSEQAVSLPNWQQNYSQLSPGCFRGRIGIRGNSCFSVFVEHSNARTEQAVCGDFPLSFAILLGRVDQALFDGRRVGCSDVMLIRRGVPLHFLMPANGWIAALQCHDFSFHPSSGDAVTDRIHSHTSTLTNQVIRSPELAAAVRAIILEELRTDRMNRPREARQFVRLDGVRRALESAPTHDVGFRDDVALRGKWHVVMRAKQLVEAQAFGPLSIAEIAGTLGLSERTLEYAFAEVFGMSPKAYFTLSRLNGLRRDLMAEPLRSGMVADLAGKWGFSHFGRLSENYRKFYGETPRETVRTRPVSSPPGHGQMTGRSCPLVSVSAP